MRDITENSLQFLRQTFLCIYNLKARRVHFQKWTEIYCRKKKDKESCYVFLNSINPFCIGFLKFKISFLKKMSVWDCYFTLSLCKINNFFYFSLTNGRTFSETRNRTSNYSSASQTEAKKEKAFFTTTFSGSL